MAYSNIPVTGGNIDTFRRTIGGTVVEDQVVVPGEYHQATYLISATSVALTTSGTHIFQIAAGASSYGRIRRIRLFQAALASSATTASFDLVRISTAGTGGTAITPRRLNQGQAAATITARSGISSPGTLGDDLGRYRMPMDSAHPTNFNGPFILWDQKDNEEPLIIGTGTGNGVVIQIVTGIASATVDIIAEVVETTYLGLT